MLDATFLTITAAAERARPRLAPRPSAPRRVHQQSWGDYQRGQQGKPACCRCASRQNLLGR